jgi:hypothetical protein
MGRLSLVDFPQQYILRATDASGQVTSSRVAHEWTCLDFEGWGICFREHLGLLEDGAGRLFLLLGRVAVLAQDALE